jgi:hypothetical protein
MDQAVLVNDLERGPAGRTVVARLAQAGVPITAAFWYWDEDAQESRLVVASPLVDEAGALAVYQRLVAIFRQEPDLAVRLFSRVFVVGAHDRLVARARTGLVDATFLVEPPGRAA